MKSERKMVLFSADKVRMYLDLVQLLDKLLAYLSGFQAVYMTINFTKSYQKSKKKFNAGKNEAEGERKEWNVLCTRTNALQWVSSLCTANILIKVMKEKSQIYCGFEKCSNWAKSTIESFEGKFDEAEEGSEFKDRWLWIIHLEEKSGKNKWRKSMELVEYH